jgi:hypothetical protein
VRGSFEYRGRVEVLEALACFAVFLGLYAVLPAPIRGPVQWRWLAAVTIRAAVAPVISFL